MNYWRVLLTGPLWIMVVVTVFESINQDSSPSLGAYASCVLIGLVGDFIDSGVSDVKKGIVGE